MPATFMQLPSSCQTALQKLSRVSSAWSLTRRGRKDVRPRSATSVDADAGEDEGRAQPPRRWSRSPGASRRGAAQPEAFRSRPSGRPADAARPAALAATHGGGAAASAPAAPSEPQRRPARRWSTQRYSEDGRLAGRRPADPADAPIPQLQALGDLPEAAPEPSAAALEGRRPATQAVPSRRVPWSRYPARAQYHVDPRQQPAPVGRRRSSSARSRLGSAPPEPLWSGCGDAAEAQVAEDAGRTFGGDEPEEPCAVCMDQRSQAILRPCGHTQICFRCACRLNPRLCPLCRTPIDRIVITGMLPLRPCWAGALPPEEGRRHEADLAEPLPGNEGESFI